MKQYSTTYAVGPNNFLIGIASAFCLFGNFFTYIPSSYTDQPDAQAIENDWGMVGQDILEAIHGQQAQQK